MLTLLTDIIILCISVSMYSIKSYDLIDLIEVFQTEVLLDLTYGIYFLTRGTHLNMGPLVAPLFHEKIIVINNIVSFKIVI